LTFKLNYVIPKIDPFKNKGGVEMKKFIERLFRAESQEEKTRRKLSHRFNCREDQISLTSEEAISGDIKYHQGYLYLDTGSEIPEILRKSFPILKRMDEIEKSGSKLKLPEIVDGYLELLVFLSAEQIILPQKINGDFITDLSSVKGLIIPDDISGNIDLRYLESSEDLVLPENFRGIVYLNKYWSDEEKAAIKERYPNLKIEFVYY